MIKRAVIFVALLVGGFVALYALVDPVQDSSAGSETDPTAPPELPRGDQQPGISIPTRGNQKSTVRFQPGGEISIPRYQRIERPGGGTTDVLVYRVHAQDSRSEAGNRLALDQVTIDFYRTDTSTPELRTVKTSIVTATRAIVELTRDDEQKVLIAEDKLMEFWNLVYRAGSDPSLSDTRITAGHVQAVNTPDMIHLWTPDPDEEVRLQSHGGAGIEVVGHGLDAWVPSYRNQKGEVELKAVGVRDVKILNRPVLTRGRTTLRSAGPLRLKEDARTGAVLVSMERQVELRSLHPAKGRRPARTLTATGDHLDAVLFHASDTDPSAIHWRRLDLRGTPIRLSDRADLTLTCGTLSLLPDANGDPVWITAAGNDALAPVVEHVVEGRPSTYRCRGKVHVVQIGRQHGFFLESFGLVAGIPTELDQLVLFEGAASLTSARDDLRISSSRGLTLLRSSLPDLRDYVVLRGRGDIQVTSTLVRAAGNKGFVLRQHPTLVAGTATLRRDIRLGPEQSDPGHRYDLHKLPNPKARPGSRDRQGFRLVGTGSCQVRLQGEAAEEVHLGSLAEDIEIRVDGDAGRLWQVRKLDIWFRSDGTPGSFVALGKECRLALTTEDDEFHGKAAEIHQPAANTYRLVGDLAEASSRQYGRLRGRDILIHRLTDEDIRLRASSDAQLKVVAVPQKAAGAGRRRIRLDLDLHADEIRLEPFLVAPPARAYLTSLVPAHGQGVPSRYLFAEGKVRFDYVIRDGQDVRSGSGQGDALTLRTDRDGELFTDGRLAGQPATISSLDTRGRKTTAASYAVEFLHDTSGEFITLLPVADHRPVLRLLDVPAASRGEPMRLALTCAGPIALQPDQIRCPAPVEVRSLLPSGAVDPGGYRLDANSMDLERTDRGEIATMQAHGDVRFRWADASGKCDVLTIDIPNTLITAKGSGRPATVEIPTGTSLVTQLNYNYRTKMFVIWKGRVLTKR